jgi:hypothetical protein
MNHGTRVFMLGYLIGIAVIETQTLVFHRHPLLMWASMIGVVAIFARTARCARHYWTEIREEGVALSLQ